jgi:hypothetical protein
VPRMLCAVLVEERVRQLPTDLDERPQALAQGGPQALIVARGAERVEGDRLAGREASVVGAA